MLVFCVLHFIICTLGFVLCVFMRLLFYLWLPYVVTINKQMKEWAVVEIQTQQHAAFISSTQIVLIKQQQQRFKWKKSTTLTAQWTDISKQSIVVSTWLMRYMIFVRMRQHFLALIGVSLNVRAYDRPQQMSSTCQTSFIQESLTVWIHWNKQ